MIGAMALCVLSVYAINKSHKLYVEETGAVVTVLSIIYAAISAISAYATYHAIKAFMNGGS